MSKKNPHHSIFSSADEMPERWASHHSMGGIGYVPNAEKSSEQTSDYSSRTPEKRADRFSSPPASSGAQPLAFAKEMPDFTRFPSPPVAVPPVGLAQPCVPSDAVSSETPDFHFSDQDSSPLTNPSAPAPPPKKPGLRPARVAMLCLCLGVCVFCVVQLVSYFADTLRTRSQNEELREAFYSTTEAPSDEPAVLAATVSAASPTDVPAVAEASVSASTASASPLDILPASNPSAPAEAAAYDPSASRTRLTAYPDNPMLRISERFQTLRRQNKDIVGWLSIPGVLDDAVVQRDNEYYLNRDYRGYHNVTGALFMDESCELTQVPEQIVIHGHNMKTGAMFGILKKYKTSGVKFYKENPYITLSTIYEEARYVIYAVSEINIRPESSHFVDFLGYSIFDTDEQFSDYINQVKALSYYNSPVEVLPSDRLLTLATCSGTDDDTRLLVMARMLRENEDMLKLNEAIYSTVKK